MTSEMFGELTTEIAEASDTSVVAVYEKGKRIKLMVDGDGGQAIFLVAAIISSMAVDADVNTDDIMAEIVKIHKRVKERMAMVEKKESLQ